MSQLEHKMVIKNHLTDNVSLLRSMRHKDDTKVDNSPKKMVFKKTFLIDTHRLMSIYNKHHKCIEIYLLIARWLSVLLVTV